MGKPPRLFHLEGIIVNVNLSTKMITISDEKRGRTECYEPCKEKLLQALIFKRDEEYVEARAKQSRGWESPPQIIWLREYGATPENTAEESLKTAKKNRAELITRLAGDD